MTVVAPILIGVAYVLLNSLVREPRRRRLLSGGGLGAWGFAFTIAVTLCAHRGLGSWTSIGIAWLPHTGWDVLHP